MSDHTLSQTPLVVHTPAGRQQWSTTVRTEVSGVVANPDATVGRVTPALAAVWRVTIGGGATGGTFTLTYEAATTTALARAAAAATVEAALVALTPLGAGNVAVTGDAGGPWTVALQGELAAVAGTALTATSSLTGGTPTLAVATLQAGSTGHLAPPVGAHDDLPPATHPVAEAVAAAKAANPTRTTITGAHTTPVPPASGAEATAKLWRGHVFAARIAIPQG